MSELINNSENRKEKLKGLIRSLHEGKSMEEAQLTFQKEFGEVSTEEISEIEKELIKEGLPVEEVQRLCDVHASIFKGGISEIHKEKVYTGIPGHPLNVLMEENRAIEKVINEEIIPYVSSYRNKKDKASMLMIRIGFDRLSEIDIHYKRKENLFFPYLEKHGVTAPPKVMWGVDDEIRDGIKEIISITSSPSVNDNTLLEIIDTVIHKTNDMIFKEDNILIPLISENLSFYEFIKIDEATPEIGYCLVKPTKSWKVETPEEKELKKEINLTDEVSFDAGSMTPAVINAVLNTLPFDLTFVDADDKVKYFTQGKERIFARPKTIIGRDVSMCHPPQSVHVVEGIVDSFRSGDKEHEDFWIRSKDKFIYIRYFAVRDNDGKYLGTLEVTQDIKPITELKGEKRLVSK